MSNDDRPDDEAVDDEFHYGSDDATGNGWAGATPPWGTMPPWAAPGMMGFPGMMPPMGPYAGQWGAPPGMWGAPPFAGPMSPPWMAAQPVPPVGPSMQAFEAMMHMIAARADLWHHFFATFAEAAASAARTSHSLWDRGPAYARTQQPGDPAFFEALAASLRNMSPEQSSRVLQDVVMLHAADAGRREGLSRQTAASAGTGRTGDIDPAELKKHLSGLSEEQQQQVLWAVRVGQELRRGRRSGARTDSGYDR
jgi:hypothetical protein